MSFFHLVIHQDENGVTAADQSDPSTERPIALPDSDPFRADLTALRARGAEGPQVYLAQEKFAKRVGEALFNAIFPSPLDALFRKYAAAQKPRLALHLPRSLFALPWEVLRDPQQRAGQFLSRVGSVVRCDDSASSGAEPSSLKERKKLLAVSSSPSNRPILGDIGWKNSKVLTFKRIKPPTFDNFKTAIENASDCDGFVFWGHGDLDPATRSGLLVFVKPGQGLRRLVSYEDDPIEAYNVASPFKPRNPLRLAYVFACESAAWDEQKLAFESSVVGALLERTDLTFVLGAQTNIDVRAAEVCLDRSLDALNWETPLPLDLAISEGRERILRIRPEQGSKFSALDWWVPAIYVKREFFNSFGSVELPSDPSAVRYPPPEAVASAAPVGGLAAAKEVTTIDALRNVAGSTLKGMLT